MLYYYRSDRWPRSDRKNHSSSEGALQRSTQKSTALQKGTTAKMETLTTQIQEEVCFNLSEKRIHLFSYNNTFRKILVALSTFGFNNYIWYLQPS